MTLKQALTISCGNALTASSGAGDENYGIQVLLLNDVAQ